MSGATRVAAIDCGTNSTRLLVAEVNSPGADDGADDSKAPPVALERLMEITRLGQGVDAAGNLAPQAIARCAAVLRRYRRVLDELGVPADARHVRVIATSAARDASNRDELFAMIGETVGVDVELLSGEEEGRLSFAGATAAVDPAGGPFVVVDIGGGSTELITGTVDHHRLPHVTGVHSVDVGCVRLTERYLRSDPPTPKELAAARTAATEQLGEAVQALPQARSSRTMIGLAGTVSALASIDAGAPVYDRDTVHHRRLTAARVEAMMHELCALPVAERRTVTGLEAARADVILGGIIVLQSVLDVLGFTELLTSEADILDGLVASLATTGARGE